MPALHWMVQLLVIEAMFEEYGTACGTYEASQQGHMDKQGLMCVFYALGGMARHGFGPLPSFGGLSYALLSGFWGS